MLKNRILRTVVHTFLQKTERVERALTYKGAGICQSYQELRYRDFSSQFSLYKTLRNDRLTSEPVINFKEKEMQFHAHDYQKYTIELIKA